MILHYLSHHSDHDKNLLGLLKRSKKGFDIKIGQHAPRKDIETHPSVVYLDPELQAIIDYKDSLTKAEEFNEYRMKLGAKLASTFKTASRHVSRRLCGNLTAFGKDESEHEVDQNNDDCAQSAPNTGATQLNNRGIFSNINTKDDAPTDSDPAADLQLSKRDIDAGHIFGDRDSKIAHQPDKRVKGDADASGNRRVSRRCANLV